MSHEASRRGCFRLPRGIAARGGRVTRTLCLGKIWLSRPNFSYRAIRCPLKALINCTCGAAAGALRQAGDCHTSVTGAACVYLWSNRARMDKVFSKMFPWRFCLRVLAAVLAIVVISPARAQTPRLDATRVAGGFTAPVFVAAPPGDTRRLFVEKGHRWIRS